MLKSRTEKGLHIPLHILLDFYTPSALFKRSHLIFFFSRYFILNRSNPRRLSFTWEHKEWRLPFVPASRLRTVTLLQLSAFHPPIETPAHCQLRVSISTNFICKTKSKSRHSSNTIYKENSLSWKCNIQNQHHSHFWYLEKLL